MSSELSHNPTKFSRRDFLKITAISGALLAGGGMLRNWLRDLPGRIQETRLLMGTVINLTVIAEDVQQAQDALAATFNEMERLIAIYTHRQSNSPLARLNATGTVLDPPEELVSLLRKAVGYSELSGGAFDVTVKPVLDAYQQGQPLTSALLSLVDYKELTIDDTEVRVLRPGMQVTLDGIAKGAVVDGGVGILKALGFENVLVEAGGDLVANGQRDAGQLWRVGVENPRAQSDGGALLGALAIQDRAMATSGDYMHTFTQDYSLNHIIVPGSGLSPAELSSVSVMASRAQDADALSTTLMVLGREKGLALVESLPNTEALLVSKTLEINTSSGFPRLT